MKCLVLGGGGFIGSHIVDGLLAVGQAVRVFERPRVPLDEQALVSDDEAMQVARVETEQLLSRLRG